MQLYSADDHPSDLPAYDNEIITGDMGDCVSVIVLWNLVGTTYQHMRGQHGLGGIEAVDFNALFNGVPDAALTQVIVIASAQGTSMYLLSNVGTLIAAQLPNATIRVVANCANAGVNRHGIVRAIN